MCAGVVYLFLVQYTDSQFTALHYILAQANNIESIHVTGSFEIYFLDNLHPTWQTPVTSL